MTRDSEADPELQVPFGHNPKICGPAMDEDDARADDYRRGFRDAGLMAIAHWKETLVVILRFKGNTRLAVLCVAGAHGFWGLIPYRDQVAIARRYGCERANVCKLMGLIQADLSMKSITQRSETARKNMSKSRIKQLV